MDIRDYRIIRKGVMVYEKLKAILPTKKCIEQVIRYIYNLDSITEVVELKYEDYIKNKKEILSNVGQYDSMMSYKDCCPYAKKVYFETNGDIVKDSYIDKMICVDDDLYCDREQYIVFVLWKDMTISDTSYKGGSLAIVKHFPVKSLTMYEKHIAKILNIK